MNIDKKQQRPEVNGKNRNMARISGTTPVVSLDIRFFRFIERTVLIN